MNRDTVTDLNHSHTLPRLQPELRRALNRLYDDAPPIPVACAPMSGDLHFVCFDDVPAGIEPWGWHRFKLGSHPGSLALDGVGLASLLGEARADLLPAELRTILLADALHPVVDALKSALRLGFDWMPDTGPAAAPHESAIGFELRAPDGGIALRGLAILDDGAAALETLVPAYAPRRLGPIGRFDALLLPLHFELGSTQIPLKEIRQIRAGDVVGIERWASSGPALRVMARAGGRGGVHLTGLADNSHITLTAIEGASMTRVDPSASDPPLIDDPSGLPLGRLDALEVVLRFEVGELSLSIGELRSLKPGHVFDLGQELNRSSVRILAHGNVLGKGYLVAVGDRLGVRVSDFAPSEL